MVVGLEPTRKITCLIPFFFLQTSISSFRTLNHHLTLSPCGTDENRTHIVGSSDRCLDQLGNSSMCTPDRIRTHTEAFGEPYATITLQTRIKYSGRHVVFKFPILSFLICWNLPSNILWERRDLNPHVHTEMVLQTTEPTNCSTLPS